MIAPKNTAKGRHQVACIACLYSCGMGSKRIARLTHYTSSAVIRAMRRHGLPLLTDEQRRTIISNNSRRRKTQQALIDEENAKIRRNISIAIRKTKEVFSDELEKENRIANANKYVMRYKTEPQFMLKVRMRRRVRKMVKSQGTMKLGSTISLVGCSSEKLKDHIESKFSNGMGWHNYGLWHIDHIRPCSSFDLTTEAGQRECFHWSNLQPLWKLDNLRKGNRMVDCHINTSNANTSKTLLQNFKVL